MRIVSDDNFLRIEKCYPSVVFALGDSGGSDIAKKKDMLIAAAVGGN